MVTPDFIVGIMGNIVSLLVYAAPIGTFWEIVKKKSSENYDVLPHITTLLCKSLWMFYGAVDPADGILIITVNGIGVVAESIYIIVYLIYAPEKVNTLILVGTLNLAFVGSVIALAIEVFHEECKRHTFMGILCVTVTIAMYVAPLKTMRNVIKTKSVHYMPFFLSFVLLLNAGCWFTFAAILRDYYVIVSNAIGILSSASQIVLYFMYKNKTTLMVLDEEIGSIKLQVTKIQNLDKDDHQVDKPKLENTKSLPKLALPGRFSIKKNMRTLSLSQFELESV